MPGVCDVAQNILTILGEATPMKLQKLCYYAQAWSLAWEGEELFPEEFEAWKTGPVCLELNEKIEEKSNLRPDDAIGDADALSTSQKVIVARVAACYGLRDAQWLGRLTMMEDPWVNAADGIVTKESMRDYYASL